MNAYKVFEGRSKVRQISKAAALGAILFQSCQYGSDEDMRRSEKILDVINVSKYAYILKSYLTVYCEERLTPKGNNLLQILDDYGINPKVGVNPLPIAPSDDQV